MTSSLASSITSRSPFRGNYFSANISGRSDNISRTLEGCTSSTSRHFIASSMDPIEGWLEHKCYNTLLKFVLDTILNILRDKLETIKETKPLAKASNDLVVVELCTIHKLISYPDFSQICQVINIVDRATQPALKTTAGMLRCERDSQLMSKYIPQYKNGQEYNFSDKSAFTFGMTKEITE